MQLVDQTHLQARHSAARWSLSHLSHSHRCAQCDEGGLVEIKIKVVDQVTCGLTTEIHHHRASHASHAYLCATQFDLACTSYHRYGIKLTAESSDRKCTLDQNDAV
eukprot:7116070-Prymnesium_polylepis.1